MTRLIIDYFLVIHCIILFAVAKWRRTPNEFVFGKADHPFLKEVWKATKSDEEHDKKCDFPTVSRLMSRDEGCFKLSRWVCQHASEWADEADFKSQVKTFLEENSKEDDDSQAKAKAKYERLEAKIANLAWWKDVKAEGFPASSTVFHFFPEMSCFIMAGKNLHEGIFT